VDEVKDIRDQAQALQIYAQQVRNIEAERKACEIRLRAERRSGETLDDLGISKSQSSRWEKLAEVPGVIFEQKVVKPGASIDGILTAHEAYDRDMLPRPHPDPDTRLRRRPAGLRRHLPCAPDSNHL
jgi:hypothetical protein